MESSNPARQRQLDLLITEVARKLMGVPVGQADEAIDDVLAQVVAFFSVDQAFLRRNDHEAGHSTLVSEWPRREEIPDPDPFAQIPFDANPVAALSGTLKEVAIAYPEDSPEHQGRVGAGSGAEPSTLALAPLFREDVTIGSLGLLRFGHERWEREEVDTVAAICSLLEQMWGRHEAESRIIQEAFTDELTGLPNRRHLEKRLAELVQTSTASLMVIDVDNMKIINDGLTYATGNEFLQSMADRLRTAVRSDNIVARLAGDQFAVLAINTVPEKIERLAQRLVDELGRPYEVDGVPIVRTVSIGVAHDAPGVLMAGEHDLELLKDAGLAMSEAKKAGKNRLAIFDEAMYDRLSQAFQVEMELRNAVEAGDQLCLHYQPEVDLRTGRIVAVEALMRWNHPHRGLLSAGVFVEVAEDSGLIVEIGDFVLREAVSQLSKWQELHPDLMMRVNVSPAHLMSRDLSGQIRSLTQEFGVRPDHLCIEVTEHVMIADHEFTMGILNELRAMGVQIALDDFGTGYSSMEQLKRLPVDALKIDRAFIIELATSEKDAAIVDATILLAEALKMSTVAEGVEEEDQIRELLKRGCFRAQGFLLARPAAPEDVVKLFDKPLVAGDLVLGAEAAVTSG